MSHIIELSRITFVKNIEKPSLIHCSLSVAFVCTSDHFSEFFVGHVFSELSRHHLQVLEGDHPVTISIKELEGIL